MLNVLSDRQGAKWVAFLGRRVGIGAVVCVVLLAVTFLLVHVIPGDPVRRVAGPAATPEYVSHLRAQLGLDQPIAEQFIHYVSGALHGRFGDSIQTGQPVLQMIEQRLPFTLKLTLTAVLVASALGVAMGLCGAVAAYHGRHPALDQVVRALCGAGGVVPEVVYGTVLILVLAIHWSLLPVAGADGWRSLILPVLAVAIRPAFNIARVVRIETLSVLEEQYIRTAQSKRLSAFRVYVVHTLPNISAAVLTLSGLLFGYLLGGVVVVEILFAWPGVGSAVVDAVINRDYPVIQGIVLVLGFLVLAVNLFIDLILAVIDKRRLAVQ